MFWCSRTHLAAVLLVALAPAVRAHTVHVAGDGVDAASCGAGDQPCRSITQAIQNAAAGDQIVVGPGVYKGEGGAPGCDCFLAVNKRVSVVSSDGAASSIIDATSAAVHATVLVTAEGSEVGRPGKGFLVTSPGAAQGSGIVIQSKDVKIRGNQVVADRAVAAPLFGISAPVDGPVLVEANQVMLWSEGIFTFGAHVTVRKNQVSRNGTGLEVTTTDVGGNVVSGNAFGMNVGTMANVVGNAFRGNGIGMDLATTTAATVTRNDISGNGDAVQNCGLRNKTLAGFAAANNYWGAASGPGPRPADDVCDGAPGTTTTSPSARKAFNVKVRFKP